MCGRFFCFLLFFIHHWKDRCFSGCTQNEAAGTGKKVQLKIKGCGS